MYDSLTQHSSFRRPPPLSSLGTGTGKALHGCAMFSVAYGMPVVAEEKYNAPYIDVYPIELHNIKIWPLVEGGRYKAKSKISFTFLN